MKTLMTFVFSLFVTMLYVPCGSVWGTSGTMAIGKDTTLTEDHNGSIVIRADNVTLDCASHRVTGPGDGCRIGERDCGIELDKRTHVTVQNCIVTDFKMGIVLRGSTHNVFRNNMVAKNSPREGFRVGTSDHNQFISNTVEHNGKDGFDLTRSNGNLLLGNVVRFNGGADDPMTPEKDMDGNGIELDFCDNNVLEDNTVLANLQNGISIGSSNGNVFNDNNAVENAQDGFKLNKSGPTDPEPRDNTFIANSGCDNGSRDADQDESIQDRENRFFTRNQFERTRNIACIPIVNSLVTFPAERTSFCTLDARAPIDGQRCPSGAQLDPELMRQLGDLQKMQIPLCPPGYDFIFTFNAKLADKASSPDLRLLAMRVVDLTTPNQVLVGGATTVPLGAQTGGAGSILTVPKSEGFEDGILSRTETVQVPFAICLKDRVPFSFHVDVWGANVGAPEQCRTRPRC